MKKPLSLLILLTCGLAWVGAQDATSLQVAPSDQVKYPDASEILNKTEPKPAAKAPAAPAASPATLPATLPTAKPLLATTPVPAKAPAPAKPAVAAPPAPDLEHGWFLSWTLSGTESAALGWAQALGLSASVRPLANGNWEVWAGPLSAAALKTALAGQGGVATLVRR